MSLPDHNLRRYFAKIRCAANAGATGPGPANSDSGKKQNHEARLPVLLYLILAANKRLRTWHGVETVMEHSGYQKAAVTEALAYLQACGAIYNVPAHLRVGDEKRIHGNRKVWQLTGIMVIDGDIIDYLYLPKSERDGTYQEIAEHAPASVKALYARLGVIEGVIEADSAGQSAGKGQKIGSGNKPKSGQKIGLGNEPDLRAIGSPNEPEIGLKNNPAKEEIQIEEIQGGEEIKPTNPPIPMIEEIEKAAQAHALISGLHDPALTVAPSISAEPQAEPFTPEFLSYPIGDSTVGKVWDLARNQLELQYPLLKAECLPFLKLVDVDVGAMRFVFEAANWWVHNLALRNEASFRRELANLGGLDFQSVQVGFRDEAVAAAGTTRFLQMEMRT